MMKVAPATVVFAARALRRLLRSPLSAVRSRLGLLQSARTHKLCFQSIHELPRLPAVRCSGVPTLCNGRPHLARISTRDQ